MQAITALAFLALAAYAAGAGYGFYGYSPAVPRIPFNPGRAPVSVRPFPNIPGPIPRPIPRPAAPLIPGPLPRPAAPVPTNAPRGPLAGELEGSHPLQQVAGWTYLNFAGIDPQTIIPENGVFTGFAYTPDRLFLSLPRSREGTPATLTWLPNDGRPSVNQPLNPYPDWSWQQGHLDNCSGLVSVFRSRIDSCGRLWALDSGVLTPLDGNPVRACPPRLVAFDLRTNLAVRSVTFPPQVLRDRSLLTTLVLDEDHNFPGNCDNMFIYVSDTSSPGMIVYDLARDATWRFEDRSLTPDPRQATYNIAGESFYLEDGVVGMTLSNLGSERMLFYHPLARRSLFAVPTQALQNPDTPRLPVIQVGEKTSQGAGIVSDATGELYFSPVSETAIASWSPNTGLQRILAVDEQRLQFISDMTVDPQGNLWMVSNRFQSFFQRTYNPRGINLRILRIPFAVNGPQLPAFSPLNFNRIVRNSNSTVH